MEQLRIDYDEDSFDIMDKVNRFLSPYNLTFVCDEQFHDGYDIYTLTDTKSLSSGRMGEP